MRSFLQMLLGIQAWTPHGSGLGWMAALETCRSTKAERWGCRVCGPCRELESQAHAGCELKEPCVCQGQSSAVASAHLGKWGRRVITLLGRGRNSPHLPQPHEGVERTCRSASPITDDSAVSERQVRSQTVRQLVQSWLPAGKPLTVFSLRTCKGSSQPNTRGGMWRVK